MARFPNYQGISPKPVEGRSSEPASVGIRLEALANLAHELRTPVQVLLGYIDTLRDGLRERVKGESEAESRRGRCEIVERMNANAHDLACAVENVMEFASASAFACAPIEEEIDLAEFFDELRPIMQAANGHKGLTIAVELDGAPPVIRCCRRALRAIVLNLATNAIKFTRSGTVTIAVWGSRQAGVEALEVEVRDTGPGILPELVRDAFAPLVQLSRSNTRAHRGLGLGLAVVRRNVDALQATLRVKSRPDVGSTFGVSVPCHPLGKAAAVA